MYPEKDDAPAFEKFYLPFGGRLHGDNRWVKMNDLIPSRGMRLKSGTVRASRKRRGARQRMYAWPSVRSSSRKS